MADHNEDKIYQEMALSKQAQLACPAVNCQSNKDSAQLIVHWCTIHIKNIHLFMCPFQDCQYKHMAMGHGAACSVMELHVGHENVCQDLGWFHGLSLMRGSRRIGLFLPRVPLQRGSLGQICNDVRTACGEEEAGPSPVRLDNSCRESAAEWMIWSTWEEGSRS